MENKSENKKSTVKKSVHKRRTVAKSKVKSILDTLEETYPDAECALNFKSTFQLLIAVVLSAQTTDKSVNLVTPALFDKYPTAKDMMNCSQEEMETFLKRIGMYRTKAKNVIALCKMLVEKFDGEVPESHEALKTLPGVGRKTANVVMSVGFGHPAIAVDTHVFRVSNRIGLVSEDDVLKTELALMDTIPKKRWSKTHHSLIFHGRNCCTARKPKCDECDITDVCKKNL